MISAFQNKGVSDDCFGIDGYAIPTVEASPKKKHAYGCFNRSKAPGPIESEMKYRRNYPGAGAYHLTQEKTWTEQAGKKGAHADFTRAPRRMMAQQFAENANKPERSTPSPQAYNINLEKYLPAVGKGGASLLQA